MNPRLAKNVTVGIIANPASGRDIRRLVARASVFPVAEKCQMITRLLSGLGSTGVRRVLTIPDVGGIAERLRRALLSSDEGSRCWPQVEFLDMPIEDGPQDTLRAVERMIAAGVSAIIVLGGDGTHRWVAEMCGQVPLAALSTGTNNVFPEIREATIAGIATGLVATGKVSKEESVKRNKVLRVEVNRARRALAVVDVSVSSEWFLGSRALWRPESLSQIFVTFSESDAIGLSAVAGAIRPISRRQPVGLRLDLAPLHETSLIVNAAIAPGLVAPMGIAAVHEIRCGESQLVKIPRGVIAIDGEREIEFGPDHEAVVWLDLEGPLTIDFEQTMTLAAKQGLFAYQQVATVLAGLGC
jgi:predicted polyphosphate/ATP-dependent NAD kinase